MLALGRADEFGAGRKRFPVIVLVEEESKARADYRAEHSGAEPRWC
jgi:hypothetical protein